MSDPKTIQDQLAAPFENVQWRLQQASPKNAKQQDGRYAPGTRGLFMAYIDARQLYDRLDQVLGFGNWQRTVKAVNGDGSVIVALSIRIGDEWITHEDIGYPNNPGASYETEPLKAAVSDGAKRAAVGLGVGRFLYELDAEWVEIDEWGKPKGQFRGAAPKPAQSTPAHQPEQVPPRARTTSENTIPASAPAEQSPLDANAATPKQFKFIQAIAREHGMSDEELNRETRMLYQKDVSALDRREASAFIERLQSRRLAS